MEAAHPACQWENTARTRVAAIERDAEMKWKRKVVIGLETLAKEIEHHPEARAALTALNEILRHPFDPTESSIADCTR